jgi:hypothetical protein
MYTTIEHLKKCAACVGGYTRMLTFFSLDKSMKEVPIPLWMVSMACGTEDVQWVCGNALIVDPEEYRKFRRTYLNAVLQHLYWSSYSSTEGNMWHRPKMNPIAKEAMLDMLRLGNSFEAAEAFIEKYQNYNIDHFIWTRVFDKALSLPAFFINYILDNFNSQLKPETVKILDVGAYPIRGRWPEDIENAPRKRVSIVNDDDEESDEDGEELDMAPPARLYPSKQDPYFFGTAWVNRKNTQGNIDIAKLLTGSDDPHVMALEWMAKHRVMEKNRIKGFMLSQASEGDYDGEPPSYHMTFNTSDPQNIFDLFRLVTAKNSSFEDVIQSTRRTADEVERQLKVKGVTNTSAIEIDKVEVDTEGKVTLAEEREAEEKEYW